MLKLSVLVAACSLVSFEALAAPSPIAYTQRSSAWWGTSPTPANVVTVIAEDVRPDATVSGNVSVPVTCRIPSPSTLRLTAMCLQVDGLNAECHFNAAVVDGQRRTLTIDSTKYTDGWHEIRARCFASETVGPEQGHSTQTTNGHPLYFKNGKPIGAGSHSVQPGIVDTHPWYDTDVSTGDSIHYVYTQLLNIHSLVDAPLAGVVPVTGRVMNAGATTLSCFMLSIDGHVVLDLDDGTELHTTQLDTRQLSNGPHLLQLMGEGRARSGKLLRGLVEVPFVVAN